MAVYIPLLFSQAAFVPCDHCPQKAHRELQVKSLLEAFKIDVILVMIYHSTLFALVTMPTNGLFYFQSYPAALALIASGQVNVKPLVTHHFKLEESLQAFETSRTGAGGAIKVMIHCDQ